MDTILITGGAGFLGSSLVNVLLKSGKYNVIVCDNLSRGKKVNISKWIGHSNFKFVSTDMLDLSVLQRLVEPCDIVFHLAGYAGVPLIGNDMSKDYLQDILATHNLLEAMKSTKQCKNLIYASSSTVYGETGGKPASELNSPLKPISIYGATKLACESLICGYCHMFDISCAVVRLANIIGPSGNRGVVYDFVSKLYSNPEYLDILGNGKQTKSYLYVDDCIDALISLLGRVEKMGFETFNVGSDDTITVLEIANIVIEEMSLNDVDKRFTNTFEGRGWKGDVTEIWLDCSKLKSFGWRPKYVSRDAVLLTGTQLIKRLKK
jgi:UDP-glucose 4-epimerase